MGILLLLKLKMSDDEQFEAADSGAMTFPFSAGSIRKGSHMLIKGFPCKVVEVTTSKTGKHGHAKASITGTDIFTGKKYEDSVPTSHNVDCPNVEKKEYQLISVEGDYVTIMDDAGEMREDLRMPPGDDNEELRKKIQKALDDDRDSLLTILKAMDDEAIISIRDAK